MQLQVLKTSQSSKLPKRELSSQGYDLFANADVTIMPGEVGVVPLGIKTAFDDGYVALLWDRGGMGRKGIHRFAGVVDADYRGEWMACLFNSTLNPYVVKTGDKCVQVLFQRAEYPEVTEVEVLPETLRGEGRFGSTG
jgi:dUTP pyrophosphatase